MSRPDRFGCVREQFPDLEVIEWRDIAVPSFMKKFWAVAKPGYLWRFKKMRLQIKELIQQKRFDIIHHLSPFAWRYASPAAGLGVPLIRGPLAGGLPTPPELAGEVRDMFHPYNYFRKTDSIRKRFDKQLINSYRHTDCVLVAAPYVAELLGPLPVQRCEVEIELALDEDFDNAPLCRKERGDKVELLYVGRVVRTKGVRDAIRALARMERKRDVRFTVIGDGDDLPSCKKEALHLGVADLVDFRGWCARKQVDEAFRRADTFLFPSFREPVGSVLLEAMASGLAVVVCNYGGPGAIVKESFGFKIPPMLPDDYAAAIAKKLDEIVVQPELRTQMGNAAYSYAASHFRWKEKIKRLNALYTSLLS